jgi:hypothetical protein
MTCHLKRKTISTYSLRRLVNISKSPGMPARKGSPGVFDGLYLGVPAHLYLLNDISVRFYQLQGVPQPYTLLYIYAPDNTRSAPGIKKAPR